MSGDNLGRESADSIRQALLRPEPTAIAREEAPPEASLELDGKELEVLTRLAADAGAVQATEQIRREAREFEIADAYQDATQGLAGDGFDIYPDLVESAAERLLDAGATEKLGEVIELWSEQDPEGAADWVQQFQAAAVGMQQLAAQHVQSERFREAIADAERARQIQDEVKRFVNEPETEAVAERFGEIASRVDALEEDLAPAQVRPILETVRRAAQEAESAEGVANWKQQLLDDDYRTRIGWNGIAPHVAEARPRVDRIAPGPSPAERTEATNAMKERMLADPIGDGMAVARRLRR